MKKIATVLLIISTIICQAAIPLAKNGIPQAEILIDSQSSPTVKYAAEELQHWVKEISGAKLPIVHRPGEMPFRIILDVNPKSFPNDLTKMSNNDGYAVRTIDNTVHIFGSCPKGVLNGVFKMLFKNTDIIWARPNVEFGTIFSKNTNLKLTKTDYIDIPVYSLRGWQMIRHMPSEIWQIRNGSNWSAAFITYNPKWAKFGMINEFGGGHNLVSTYIPEKKYYANHPEFYPMIDGKRVKPSSFNTLCQLCFTNQDLVNTFIKELDERIKTNPNYSTYRIMIEDNYNLCNCPECVKPIKLPNGKTVSPKDKNFRSTQFFMWLNQIARHMKNKYPGKRILTFGYFFTAIPPACPVESNISISFCPISKNNKAVMNSSENATWNKKFLDWTKNGTKLTWREYFGLVGPFPRPIDVIAMSDWKYANKHGVNRTYSEMNADSPVKNMYESWNVNSLYFWVVANGSWNPYQSVKTMRKEFLERVYGPAADDVGEFYRIIEDGWFKSGGHSSWNDLSISSWKSSVIKYGTEKACRNALERAAGKVTNPNGKKMLAALRNTFEKYIVYSKDSISTLGVKKVKTTPVFNPDFNTGEWLEAEVGEKFFMTNGAKPLEKTAVRLLYDDSNLYIGVKCFNRNPGKAFARPAGQPRDKWPAGEKFEFSLGWINSQGKNYSYQIVFDINGNLYDKCNGDLKWNGKFKVLRKITNNGWSALITIPFKVINLDLESLNKTNIKFIRYWNHKAPKVEVSFSGTIKLHMIPTAKKSQYMIKK